LSLLEKPMLLRIAIVILALTTVGCRSTPKKSNSLERLKNATSLRFHNNLSTTLVVRVIDPGNTHGMQEGIVLPGKDGWIPIVSDDFCLTPRLSTGSPAFPMHRIHASTVVDGRESRVNLKRLRSGVYIPTL
jgi:hypothetical protein